MSVTDVLSRMSAIQSQLSLLQNGATSATSATSATATSGMATGSSVATDASGSSFNSMLNGALNQDAVDSGTVGTSGPTSTTGAGTGSASGAQVVADARRYLGVPYVWGGTDPSKGLDCSGLVQRVYDDLGVSLPRVSRDQATQGAAVSDLTQAQPGDLLAFGSPVHHIAIYIGDHQMIEAPRTGLDVRVSDVYETPTAIRRIVATGEVAVPVATSSTMISPVTTAGASLAGGAPYTDLFQQAGATYGVDPSLLSAMAKQESGYDPSAVSPAGAQGLMQLMPATARSLGVTDSLDPTQAVDGAARLVSELTQRFGSTPLALAAYNAGPGAVLRYGGIPPYPETQRYVSSIMATLGAA